LCENSLDLVVADALLKKRGAEDGLKSAIDRYRKGLITNNLEVNFF
jgi:hypothetical protein